MRTMLASEPCLAAAALPRQSAHVEPSAPQDKPDLLELEAAEVRHAFMLRVAIHPRRTYGCVLSRRRLRV